MRKRILLGAAAALLAAGAFVAVQARDELPVPYRAVVTYELRIRKGKAKDKFLEVPLLTEALNNLAADGYDVDSITPWPDGRILVVGRKR
jgi:hypothetical protein